MVIKQLLMLLQLGFPRIMLMYTREKKSKMISTLCRVWCCQFDAMKIQAVQA